MKKIVEFQNLSVAYNLGKTNEAWAVKDVNCSIYPGEYVIFFGPSGCGKSTLLYTIAGLENPTEGKVFLKGKDLAEMTKQEVIHNSQFMTGMIFQAYNLIPNLSVYDNIVLPMFFAEVSFKKHQKRVKDLMRKFGIENLAKRKPLKLSGGQQQRVAIVRALVNSPSVLLADEPVGNLDSENQKLVMNLLTELNQKQNRTVILVTHDPRYLNRADRIFYIKDGKIIRTVRNPKKSSDKKMKISEYEKLAKAHPYFTESKLKSKMLLNHLVYPYSIETQQNLENIIDEYLTGKITEKEMKELFDLPEEEGGVSLYKQTAKKMTKEIVKLTGEMELVEEVKSQKRLTSTGEKVTTIRKSLLDEYSGELSLKEIKRLENLISQRLAGKINKKNFFKLLDKPFNEDGVGLNKRTAKKFSRRIELIIMKE